MRWRVRRILFLAGGKAARTAAKARCESGWDGMGESLELAVAAAVVL